MSHARFITFEGIEACGKSTQLKMLGTFLQQKHIPFLATREPGGTPGAEAIRDVLMKGAADRWLPLSEAFLLSAARLEHVVHTIRPTLEQGRWVLCDRFADSTLAYQGFGHELPLEDLEHLNKIATQNVIPNLTILLDISAEESFERIHRRSLEDPSSIQRFEQLDMNFHRRAREGFLTIAAQHAERFEVLSGEAAPETIASHIEHIIQKRFLNS